MTVARSFRGPTPVVSEEPFITLAETAARLGIARETLLDWRKHGRGPRGYRLGGRVNFRWSEVEAWAVAQREPQR